MKASVLSLVFLSGLAAAQIPSCATGCVTKFTTGNSIAGCGQLDIACICKNADFLNGIACCLTSACDKDGQDQAVQYAKQICSSAGVSTPDNVVCNENSSSSAAESSATQSATATDDSATTATTGSSDSSSTAESSETTAADSSSSAAPATTNSASRTTGGSSTTAASQTAASTSQTSTNVAAPLASAGSLVGAAIAVLAAAL
ncbi:hypothetical protein BBK36DRAFT_1168507 [Trichoderma citrinoviride]|uniref:CFEM domain-containing protein n=1 Tax=Trichoderma citrinoviride TaxID=58853 RepID=A0A2T4BCE0_9HYPO|nr:hypothetical protein BBK36DRAFT_1168507 [Trichoderma citrinoviride]PTB66993.1 hypothetical protein BBK36DRAFT_1168507 [Trichoderma citrinoviride]